jgi:EAL domain-containing protein (putative c-di-GMP-specific phosphodiesterase class I)/GGDEF domain-containing protein/PAS domain-containing protein
MSEASALPEQESSSLLENQVAELYRNSHVANLTILAVAILLAWILWPVANHDVVMIWMGYTLAITLARTVLAFQYQLSPSPCPDPKRWLTLYSAGVFLSGLGWGSVVLFIVPVNATFHLVSAIFIIGGLVTAAAGTMASLKHGYAIYSIPAMLPGALKLIWLNESNTTVLIGLFVCAFLVFIAMIAMRIHEVILHSLRKQFESTKFVVEVQEIYQALIARYDDLERQLEASNQKVRELQAALEQNGGAGLILAPVEGDAEHKARSDKFAYLLEKLHGGAWNHNLRTGEIRFSPQWLDMLGFKDDEVYPTMDFWCSLLHPDERNEVLEKLLSYIHGKLPEFFSSHRLKTRTGEWIWVFSRGQAVAWGTFGEVLDMVCVDIDIEDPEVHLAGKLSSVNFKASEWLHSETMFGQRLQYALQTTAIENIEHALCHISVYPLDRAGEAHLPPGDELARQIANVLLKECRHEEPVLELGNNRFAVLLENHSVDKALNKAVALQKILNAQEFGNELHRYGIHTYLGITPIFDQHRTVSELFDDAETACNIAYSDTLDNIFVFQRGSVEFGSGSLEKRILAKIRETLANKGLLLSATTLKPLASPASAQQAAQIKVAWLTAALPRQKSYEFAVKDLQDPAEIDSLATAFDQCALEMFHAWACAQPGTGPELVNVYIYECKLSSLLDHGFVARMERLFADRLPVRHTLCIGIAEADYIAHKEAVRAFIDALEPAGVRFALTDFGAASFSYDYMKDLPFDYLKLHESLVANIHTDKASMLTIKYLNEIGHVLNFKTLAFCSDNELQEAALGKIGTDYIRKAAPDTVSLTVSATIRPVQASGHDFNRFTAARD